MRLSEYEFDSVAVQILHCCVEARTVPVTIIRRTAGMSPRVQSRCVTLANYVTILGQESDMIWGYASTISRISV